MVEVGKMCQSKTRGGLGFRGLSSFNQALMAKQSWRIIQALDSLVARVMKRRYFRHSDFMEAKLGSNPSYIWRSILGEERLFIRASGGELVMENK